MDGRVEVFKALANETRLDVLRWLKDPRTHFETPETRARSGGGVCVGDIQEKAGLSQSTVSHYLQMMQRAGLLLSERHGQWTYYRRNEDRLREVADFLAREI